MLWTIAWRNLWRNRRRTLITAASVFFAVFFSVISTAFNRGVFDSMIDQSITNSVGHAQIMHPDYWEQRSLANSIPWTPQAAEALQNMSNVQAVVPRLEAVLFASHGPQNAVAPLIGVDPALEATATGLSGKLVEGQYLEAEDQAVLLGDGLAQQLHATVGDTLLLAGQGYTEQPIQVRYVVKGLVSFGIPSAGKMLFVPLKTAQTLVQAPERITTAMIHLPNRSYTDAFVQEATQQLEANPYSVKAWTAMMPDLLEMKSMKDSSNGVMTFILYLIITFGIFGTILMMTKERSYEFGVLVAVGMKRYQLALAVWLEIILLGLLGVAVGVLISWGLAYYMSQNPIPLTGDMAATYDKFGFNAVLTTSTAPDIFYSQALIVLAVTSLLALYPAWSIWTLRPVEAMRG